MLFEFQFENISPSNHLKNLLKPRILQNGKWHSDCYFLLSSINKFTIPKRHLTESHRGLFMPVIANQMWAIRNLELIKALSRGKSVLICGHCNLMGIRWGLYFPGLGLESLGKRDLCSVPIRYQTITGRSRAKQLVGVSRD